MSIKRKIREFLRLIYRNPRPSLNNLDRKLEKYLNKREGFFIEVGANDGYSQSNTYYLEKKLQWRGLLIEGIPELYEKCKKLRTNAIVENCALVSEDYDEDTVTMHFAHLMSVVDGSMKSKGNQEKHLELGMQMQALSKSYKVTVAARTLGSLLDEIPQLPSIDFFSLDVEGYELDVLKGLNIKKHRPTYILVEARFFEEVNAYLLANQYAMKEQLTHHDYLYEVQAV